MKTYMIQFDIAAAIITAMLIIVYFSRPAIKNHTRYYFLGVLYLLEIASITDAVGALLIDTQLGVGHWAISYAINGIYVCVIGLLALVFADYAITITIKGRRGLFRRFVINSIGAFLFILDVTSPWTHFMYYIDDEGLYHHGPGMMIQYAIAAVVLIYAIFLCVRNRKNMTVAQWFGMAAYCLLMFLGFGVQYFIPHLLITCFFASIGLCYVAFTIEDPNEHIDIVTGCFNKKALIEMVDSLTDYKRSNSIMVFGIHEYENLRLRLDIESVNKTIRNGGEVLKKYFGSDNVYYLGGSVFAIRDRSATEEAYDKFCEDLVGKYFDTPVDFGQFSSKLSPYVVIAPIYDNVRNGEEFVRIVDYAIENKKEDSSTRVKFLEKEDFDGLGRKNLILTAIKKAVALNGFEVYYQPIYSTETQSFSKAEALVRLNDPDIGVIEPDEFIPVAEKTGYIIQIGQMVMKKVCKFMDESDIRRFGVEKIDVNLSTIQCMQEDLYRNMLDIMREKNIRPSQIDFEITETAYSDEEALTHNMSKLIDAGACFSMDDYGTGFSNTQMLIKLPLDIVKIDKSILWNAMEDERAMILLKSTIRTVKDIGCKTVVEGVETQRMVDVLTEAGVEYLQGFFYSKPINEKDYLEFLTTGF